MFFREAFAAVGGKKAMSGLPIQGSDVAASWDHLYVFLFWLSAFFFVLVVGGMIYLAITYRKKPGQKTKYIVDNHALEAFWTVIPTIIFLVIFAWGWKVYTLMVRPPQNAMQINVIGKQWLWNFQYEDGKLLTNEVYVPINQPVKFLMSSEDVIHSFFIPNFRVKSDVVPGMYTTVWFEAKVPGEHQVYCTEYCGASHSLMLAKVYALEPEKWEAWKRGKEVQVTGKVASAPAPGDAKLTAVETLADRGKKLVEAKGCLACHSSDGTEKATGPTWKGVYGHEVELADGSKVTADENYIRESILNPGAKQVKGFTPVMPPYQGLLTEEELGAVIAYIKGLGSNLKTTTDTQVVQGE
jgi:cytochrome c oxidase subunit 2